MDSRNSPLVLLSDVAVQMLRILRGEWSLAQAEVKAGFRRVVAGVAMLVVAVVLAITALNLIAGAIVAGLAHAGLGPAWAALVVGGAFALATAGLVIFGMRALKDARVVPARAFHGMQRDLDALKEGLST